MHVDAPPVRARSVVVNRLGDRHVAATDVEALRGPVRHERLDPRRDALREHADTMAVRQRPVQANQRFLRRTFMIESDR